MKTCLLLALVFLVGCGVQAATPPSHEELRATAQRLTMQGDGFWKVCGGMPVAADTLRTAKHCLDKAALTHVGERPAGVYSVTSIGDDVIEVKFSQPMFKKWLRLGKARQGDRIRWWGNPKGYVDVYREGRVVAVHGKAVVVDAMVCKGDSGSGLVNDHGELVAILSQMAPEAGACMFALGEA